MYKTTISLDYLESLTHISISRSFIKEIIKKVDLENKASCELSSLTDDIIIESDSLNLTANIVAYIGIAVGIETCVGVLRNKQILKMLLNK